MSEQVSTALTYAAAGVNIEAGNQLVERIKPFAKSTSRPEVLGNLGGFGALCAIPQGYREPILVSGTDGVGTKLKLAIELNTHDTIGVDLVAMCVNDLLVSGAEPLFFLDYYASGHLNVDQAATIISGIADGCRQSGCALIGGETAELPGLYADKDYDLAGFCVGVVEKDQIITGQTIQPGDQVIGLASTGIHSNGFSLVRKVLADKDIRLDTPIQHNGQNSTLGQALLTPTQIYVSQIRNLQKTITIKGMAHITGGGITENVPRVLPQDLKAQIVLSQWQVPELFVFLAEQGLISDSEMLKTFNMGIGFVIVVAKQDVTSTLDALQTQNQQAWHIGEIHTMNRGDTAVCYV